MTRIIRNVPDHTPYANSFASNGSSKDLERTPNLWFRKLYEIDFVMRSLFCPFEFILRTSNNN